LKSKGIDHRKIDKKLDERTATMPKMTVPQSEEFNARAEVIKSLEAELTKAASEAEVASARAKLRAENEKQKEFIRSLRRPPTRAEQEAARERQQQQFAQSGGRGGFTDQAPPRQYGGKPRNSNMGGSNLCKVFVGSLAWETDDESLRRAFSKCGEINEANVVRDRATGRSRGFGFITFMTEDGASAAIETMDGGMVEGRQVKVNYADRNTGGRRREYNRGGGGYSRGGYNRGGGYQRGGYNRGGGYSDDYGGGYDDGGFQPALGGRGGGGGYGGYNDAPILGAHADLDRALEGDV